jgi:2-Cys peroxiredoxin 5
MLPTFNVYLISLSFKFFFNISYINYDVQVGDSLPNVDLYEDSPTNKVNLAQLAANKKIIIFAVPGAFTPGCSKVDLQP